VLTELLATERVVDLILGFVVIEAMALLVYAHRTGRGVAPADLLINLAAGACLLLALRGALAGSPRGWIASWLAVALFAHLMDLARRWRR
jgi:hypothetical protein